MNIKIMVGDSLERLRELPDNSVDAIVTDPPYGLGKEPKIADVLHAWLADQQYHAKGGGFMGNAWDAYVPGPAIWRECLRVLKPGGHLVSFFGTRTYDVGVMAVRIAGFEIRDQLGWVYACLSDDTEILVDGEWCHYSKATAGRLALCYDLGSDSLKWQAIEHLHVHPVSGQCYRIHSDSTDQIVTGGHRCIVERDGARSFAFARDLARERQTNVPILEGMRDVRERFPLPDKGAGIAESSLWATVQATIQAGDHANGPAGYDQDFVCSLRGGEMEAERVAAQGQDADVFQPMQRKTSGGGAGQAQPQGASGVVGGERGGNPGEDEWAWESRVARRCDACAIEGPISGPALREVSARVQAHGEAGRVHRGTPSRGGAGAGQVADELGSRAPYEPQDARQLDRESRAVCEQLGPHEISCARNTRTTLARVEPCDYTGPVWCVTVPTGAFVARRNGKVFVTGNSGFPKSLDVSKAIDKTAGAEREVVGTKHAGIGTGKTFGMLQSEGDNANAKKVIDITAPATPEAKQWDGWGTALTPSYEPIVLARKPISERTVAANVLKWGTGAINVDGTRTPAPEAPDVAHVSSGAKSGWIGALNGRVVRESESRTTSATSVGRWPKNLLIDDSDEVAEMFPMTNPSNGAPRNNRSCKSISKGADKAHVAHGIADSGGSATRMFPKFPRLKYCPKAAGNDRNDGLDSRSTHPTVKPTELMRWLCRLVTPPGGTVLDPFMGSGSTGRGAVLEGFSFVGCELDPNYAATAEARIREVSTTPIESEAPPEAAETVRSPQRTLFE